MFPSLTLQTATNAALTATMMATVAFSPERPSPTSVKSSMKSPMVLRRNQSYFGGDRDKTELPDLASLPGGDEPKKRPYIVAVAMIVRCPSCGTENRIPPARLN